MGWERIVTQLFIDITLSAYAFFSLAFVIIFCKIIFCSLFENKKMLRQILEYKDVLGFVPSGIIFFCIFTIPTTLKGYGFPILASVFIIFLFYIISLLIPLYVTAKRY